MDRATAVAAAGLRPTAVSNRSLERLAASDPDPRVRAAALGALVRAGRAESAWPGAMDDPDPAVRRRGCDLAPSLGAPDCSLLISALADRDPGVAEAAAWALGELADAAVTAGAVPALAGTARAHSDALVREAAVAALGSLGHPEGLAAVLAACKDRPAIRRRAVVALAAFDGPEVEAALERALSDHDWQVRQVAEDLRS